MNDYVLTLRAIDKQVEQTDKMARQYLADTAIRLAEHPEESEDLQECFNQLQAVLIGLKRARGDINRAIRNHTE